VRLAVLPPSAAAEQAALRPVLQWLRAGDTFVWVGIKQQAWAVLYLLGLHLLLDHLLAY
jgi:hypothetical protein